MLSRQGSSTRFGGTRPKEFKENVFKQASERLPVRRVGRPEDVARAIAYLVRDTFVTGTVLEVDVRGHLG